MQMNQNIAQNILEENVGVKLFVSKNLLIIIIMINTILLTCMFCIRCYCFLSSPLLFNIFLIMDVCNLTQYIHNIYIFDK